MPHLVHSTWHKIHGDPVVGLIPIDGLAPGDVTQAAWSCAGAETVTKTDDPGGGITVVSGADALTDYPEDLSPNDVSDTQAVLVIDIDPDDTLTIGIGRWLWQAEAGGVEASVIAQGVLVLSRRIDAAT